MDGHVRKTCRLWAHYVTEADTPNYYLTSLGSSLFAEWDCAVGIIEGEAWALPPSVVATPYFLDVAGTHMSHLWIQRGNKPTFVLNGCITPLAIRAQVGPVFHYSFEFDLRELHIILRVLTRALNKCIGESDLELICFGVL